MLLILAPLFGRTPEPRDVPGFFEPIRTATASRLSRGEWPWLNAADGCTEAWFANPETGVLYPPAWIHLILPRGAGMALEIGLHLALLALGAGLLSRRLGAGAAGVAVTEAAAWSSGAVLAMVGMLNNLEAMAWLPWIVLAAQLPGRWTVPATAAACALGWLAGEPVVWVLGVALCLGLAGQRRKAALAGVILAAGLVLVQAVPFVSWMLEGDRGGGAAIQYLSGSVAPLGWLRTLVPGVPASAAGTSWVASLFLGAPLLLLAFLGLRKRPWLAAPAAALALLATLPALGDGHLYLLLTRSLVRYPSRFAVLALALLLPFTGAGLHRWLKGEGRLPAALLALATLAALPMAPDPVAVAIAAIPAALLLAGAALPRLRPLRVAAVAAGLGATVVAGWPLLGLHEPDRARWPWTETVGTGRLYTPSPSGPARAWLARSERHLSLWPLGYHNLEAGTELVRSNAPLIHRRLELHLAHADRGPTGRWWLDTLSAPWMILSNAPPAGQGLKPIRTLRGMWLVANPRARPWIAAWAGRPSAKVPLSPAVVTIVRPRPERILSSVLAPRPTWISVSVPPVRGWSFTVDGQPVDPIQGPGILQLFRFPKGAHQLRGSYRPPGFPVTPILSGVAVLCLVLLALTALLRERRGSAGSSAVAS